MQTLLIAEQHRDLYHFLAALADVSYNHLAELQLADKAYDGNRVVVWSQGSHSELFDRIEKLEVVERHARKLGINIVLSAAANLPLRQWARQIGWTVLWEMSALDHTMDALNERYQEPELKIVLAS